MLHQRFRSLSHVYLETILLTSCAKQVPEMDTSIESFENLQTQIDILDKSILELHKENILLKNKISALENVQSREMTLLNNYMTFMNAINGKLITIPFSETNHEYEFQTSPNLNSPAIRINIAVDDFPEWYKFYQSFNGKTVYLVYEKDNVIWLYETYVLEKMSETAPSDDIIHDRKAYGIVRRISLSMELLLEDDIQYHLENYNFLDKLNFSLVFHEGSLIDGEITY